MPLTDDIANSLRLERHASTSAVHTVVGNALKSIAPDVTVRATDYFTHTFAPDLILDWGSNGNGERRSVHLRFGVDDPTFLEGLDLLAETEPIFLGLRGSTVIDPRLTHASERGHAGTLVTVASAVDALYVSRGRNRPSVRATQALVRGGRGAVDPDRATGIVSAYEEATTAIDSLADDSPEAFGQTSDALHTLERALRWRQFAPLERELRARWVKVGGDPSDFPSRSPWEPELLPRPELAEVLNALLDSRRPIARNTWVRNAGHLRAEELAEVLGQDRVGGRLDELAAALLGRWTAEWASGERVEMSLLDSHHWLVKDKTLGVALGELRVFFRDDGRRFKDKRPTQDTLPTVAQSETRLRNPAVQSASFATAVEGLTHTLKGDGTSLYERVEAMFPHRLDELRVESVTVRVPGEDHTAKVELDRQVIDARENKTAIRTLMRLAYDFFGLGTAPGWVPVEQFLNTGHYPTQENVGRLEVEDEDFS